MIQDQGKIKILQTIGKRVKLTGQMLYTGSDRWEVEIVHENGMTEWVAETDLTDI